MQDLHVDTWPLFKMLVMMLGCMVGAGVLAVLLTKKLPGFISRPVIYLAIPFGAYLYFRYLA